MLAADLLGEIRRHARVLCVGSAEVAEVKLATRSQHPIGLGKGTRFVVARQMVEGERGEHALEAAVRVWELRGGSALELDRQAADGDLPPRTLEDAVIDVDADQHGAWHRFGGEEEKRPGAAANVEDTHSGDEMRALDHAQLEAALRDGQADPEIVDRREDIASEGGDEGSVVRHRRPLFRSLAASRNAAAATAVVCSSGTTPIRTSGMTGMRVVYDQIPPRTAMNSMTAAISGAAVRRYAHSIPPRATNQSGR